MSSVKPGYDSDWYPKLEPEIPRRYHKSTLNTITPEEMQNLYTEDQIKNLYNKAYFASYGNRFRSIGYKKSSVKCVNNAANGSRLLPGSVNTNTVKEEICITNTSDKPEYVRVHIAIPTALDDGDPTFNPKANSLHFNTKAAVGLAEGKFNFGKALDREAGKYVGPSGWNFYKTTIHGLSYNVYIGTYETALNPGETTVCAVDQVYLDASFEQEEERLINIVKAIGKTWFMFALAESVPVEEVDSEDPMAVAKNVFELFDEIVTVGKYDPWKYGEISGWGHEDGKEYWGLNQKPDTTYSAEFKKPIFEALEDIKEVETTKEEEKKDEPVEAASTESIPTEEKPKE